jgi:hypothetical protein
MNIGLVIVPSPDCWRERLLGTSTKIGWKVLRHTLRDRLAIGNRLLKPCYLSRDDHNWKIRTRKQRTDVGKYSFVNRTIRSWNQYLQAY